MRCLCSQSGNRLLGPLPTLLGRLSSLSLCYWTFPRLRRLYRNPGHGLYNKQTGPETAWAGHRLQLDTTQIGLDTDYNWTLSRQGRTCTRTQTTTGPYPGRAGHRLQLDPTQTGPDTDYNWTLPRPCRTQPGPDTDYNWTLPRQGRTTHFGSFQ